VQYEFLIDRSQMTCDKKEYRRIDTLIAEPDSDETDYQINLKQTIGADKMVQVFDNGTIMPEDRLSITGTILTISEVHANHIYHILVWEEI